MNLEVMACQVIDQDFECACRDGFDEEANGTCTDIDECGRGTHDCPKKSACVNDIGDYSQMLLLDSILKVDF